METLGGVILAYVLVGGFLGVMRHYKRSERWPEAFKTAALWPKHIPNMWNMD
jgi:hypothetical protein